MEHDDLKGMSPAEQDRVLRERIANDEGGYWLGYRAGVICAYERSGMTPTKIAALLETTPREVREVLRFHARLVRRHIPLHRQILDILTRPVW